MLQKLEALGVVDWEQRIEHGLEGDA